MSWWPDTVAGASGAGQVVSPARKQREVGVEAPSSFPLLIQSRIP